MFSDVRGVGVHAATPVLLPNVRRRATQRPRLAIVCLLLRSLIAIAATDAPATTLNGDGPLGAECGDIALVLDKVETIGRPV